MRQPYLEFCKKYKRKLECNEMLEKELHIDSIEKLTFHLGYEVKYPCIITTQGPYKIFELDNEDIEYLYNKYSKKVVEEMKKKLEKIIEEYGDI